MTAMTDTALSAQLREVLGGAAATLDDGARSRSRLLRELARDGLATLPLPGAGATLGRWRALAAVAGHDLGLAKLYEGHTDAIAILAEAGDAPPQRDRTWGM
jgi:hypothetical protein